MEEIEKRKREKRKKLTGNNCKSVWIGTRHERRFFERRNADEKHLAWRRRVMSARVRARLSRETMKH